VGIELEGVVEREGLTSVVRELAARSVVYLALTGLVDTGTLDKRRLKDGIMKW